MTYLYVFNDLKNPFVNAFANITGHKGLEVC
jgi:hypothetical protein